MNQFVQQTALVQAPATDTATVPAPQIDRAALTTLMNDVGREGLEGLIALFIDQTRARLHRLAAPALTPDVALHEVHSLKGAAATVYATALSRIAERQEIRLRNGATLRDADLAVLKETFEQYRAAIASPGAGVIAISDHIAAA
jgi:HPt (histidine-containing phosphotransfer) domain-containing protein